MKKNKKFKVWMVTRIDQSLILAKYLNDKKLLVRWDSFIRLKKSGFLRFFFPYSKRILDDKLTKISGNHYLPEIISRTLNFFKFKKSILFSDIILAKLARFNSPRNFDILHGQGPYSLESGLLAKKLGKKFIYEISGQMDFTRKKQLKNLYKKYNLPLDYGIKQLENRRLKEAKIADAIICPSEMISKELCKLGLNKNKIYIYNHDSNFSKNFKKIKIKKYNKKKFVLLFVGLVSIAKGVQNAIYIQKKLLKSGINSELHIVGNIIHKFLIKDTKKYKIFFHGNQSVVQLKKFYSIANTFIFPSYTEGSALVTFEAMASGLPVLTTNDSGSIVKHGINGFICKPEEKNKMFKYAYKLATNSTLNYTMSINSRKIYNKKMTISYPKQVLNIYKKVLLNNKC
jgi:glycosyltransferase involved in cell wall biosynthesis